MKITLSFEMYDVDGKLGEYTQKITDDLLGFVGTGVRGLLGDNGEVDVRNIRINFTYPRAKKGNRP